MPDQDTKKARKVFRKNTLTCTQYLSVKDIIFHKARRKPTTADPMLHKKIKETQYHDFYHTTI